MEYKLDNWRALTYTEKELYAMNDEMLLVLIEACNRLPDEAQERIRLCERILADREQEEQS